MAGKTKFYAVKTGRQTGILHTWSECEASVKGYPEAEYKSFSTIEEAEQYLVGGTGSDVLPSQGQDSGMQGQTNSRKRSAKTVAGQLPGYPAKKDTLTAYVDGSYDDENKVYAFGCVFLFADGSMRTYIGNGTEPASLAMRNVAGEMLGAMYAMQFALKNGFRRLDICYDYVGIEKWAVGEWKTNKDLTKKYAAFMQRQGHFIEVHYHKVAAHTNQEFNEMADREAKRGLTEAAGIPPVEMLE